MAPKQFVYAILRKDFDHHTDKKGALTLVEIHAELESANTAAKAHFSKEAAKAEGGDGEPEETQNKDGGFQGQCWTRQDKRDNFTVEVKKTELKVQASKAAASGGSKANSKSTTKKAAEDAGDEDDAKPAAKKAKTSAKGTVPPGKKGALKGLKLLFTGTFDSMDRKTSIETAETYGGTIVKKLEDADYIVLGVKAGPNKLAEIEEKELKTLDEAEFLSLLETGQPPA